MTVYMCVRACMCTHVLTRVRACDGAHVRVCVRECLHVRALVRMCVCLFADAGARAGARTCGRAYV